MAFFVVTMPFEFSVGVWAFVTGLSQISSFEAKRDGVINPHTILFIFISSVYGIILLLKFSIILKYR